MVLTRRQERLLQKQYKVHKDPDQADSPGSPATPKGTTLADGRHLKSAMKTYTGPRPWESEAEMIMDGQGTKGPKKRVRIQSRDNVTHLYDRSQLSEENGDGIDDDDHEEQEYPEDGDLGEPEKDLHQRAILKVSSLRGGVLAVLAIVGWAVTSSWLIFLNRDIMRDKGFPFPLMLPAVSQLGCSMLAWSSGGLGFVSVRRPLPPREYINRLFPLALAVVMSMFLGNYAYLGLSLAFLNMLKAFTPAATLLVSAFAGMEALTPIGLLSTVLIALGTGVATVQESSHNAAFHLPSFISFTTSIGFEAARVVIAAKLLGRLEKPFNPVEMMAHVGPCVFLFLAIASVVVERQQLVALGLSGAFKLWPELGLVAVLSFLVNATSYYAIMYTSSTTFKVAGCFKNAAVVWWAMVQGDQVTVTQLYGFGLATLGFLLYTWWTASRHQIITKLITNFDGLRILFNQFYNTFSGKMPWYGTTTTLEQPEYNPKRLSPRNRLLCILGIVIGVVALATGALGLLILMDDQDRVHWYTNTQFADLWRWLTEKNPMHTALVVNASLVALIVCTGLLVDHRNAGLRAAASKKE